MNRAISRKKAFAIIAAILIMVIVSIMGQTALSMLSAGSMGAVNYMQSQQAFYLAESGIEKALLEISRGGGAWTGWSGTDPKTIQLTLEGYGDYDISVASPGSATPHVTATGYSPSRSAPLRAVRVIDVIVTRTSMLGSYALFAGGSGEGMDDNAISMSGSSYTDSYDSSKGAYNALLPGGATNRGSYGDVATNADIEVSGSAYIYGDAATGLSGDFNNTSSVSGDITHDTDLTLTYVTVPGSLMALSSGGTISSTRPIFSGDYKFTKINLTSSEVVNITGPANIYLTGTTSINATGSAQVAVDASSSGPVVIYADGDISIAGNSGIVNNTYLPHYLQLYGSNASFQEFDLGGSSAFYGVVYAPTAELDLTGSSGFYGSFIGDEIETGGSTAIHRDESLVNFNPPPFVPRRYSRTGWTEVY